MSLVRNGQFLAAFGTTRSQYTTAIGCGHSLTEAVLVVATAVVGLKCSFHIFFALFVVHFCISECKIRHFFSILQMLGHFYAKLYGFSLKMSYLCSAKQTIYNNKVKIQVSFMINSQDIKKGTCIRMDGKVYFCIDFLHRKPGKGNTIMSVTLKDVVSGNVLERRFNIGEKLEDVRVERRPYQYLYKDGEDLIFMNNETYEQISIPGEQVNGLAYMKESQMVEVVTDATTETVLYAEVPAKVHLQVVWTEPGLKGDTATNTLKPAKVETGAEVRVPLFINEGETIEVDTRDGSYLGRVK